MSNIITEYIHGRYGKAHELKERGKISTKKFVEIIDTYEEVPQHIKDFWKDYVAEKREV